MEISRVISGTSQAFFQVLMEGLLYDVNRSTNTIHQKAHVKEGFHYQKKLKNKLGHNGNVMVEVTKLQEPYVYEATFSSTQGINTLSYYAEKIDDQHIIVQYAEDFVSASSMKRMNYKLMSKLYKRSSLRKASLILDQLEDLMKK